MTHKARQRPCKVRYEAMEQVSPRVSIGDFFKRLLLVHCPHLNPMFSANGKAASSGCFCTALDTPRGWGYTIDSSKTLTPFLKSDVEDI